MSKKVAVCTKKLPPCNNICPAGEDIRRWISLAQKERFHEAWEVILQSNPFPAIHGRVCYHYCETRCNRIHYDEKVSIHCIERFLGDMAIAENWPAPVSKERTGKKILVVGAGPAGLSAAFYLHMMGHDVTIYEALAKPGGMMFTGIPAYRLPREVLAKEIERVLSSGIKIEYNRRVEDILLEKEQGGFDAMFLGVGAHLAKNVPVQVEEPCQIKVIDAIDYLRDVAFDNPPDLGKCLVVYGGGNTAIDVARTARRLGMTDIHIVYHRSTEKMSAFPKEVQEAKDEGITFHDLRSVLALSGNKLTLAINVMDEKGRPKHTDKTELMEVNTLVFALSQIPDTDFLRKVEDIEVQPNGVVSVDNFFMTGHPGIFAGGNMVPYDRSVTYAVGHGRKAANHIDAYLNGALHSDIAHKEPIPFERLHITDEKSECVKEKDLDANTRMQSFVEVVQSASQDEVKYIADRCFSCGNCFGCGKCYSVCPVSAIMHSEFDGRVTSIDHEKCIGCGKCFKVCPCGAISMVDR